MSVYLDGVGLERPAEVCCKQCDSVLGPRKRFQPVSLTGEVPPSPCTVGGGGRWSYGPGDLVVL